MTQKCCIEIADEYSKIFDPFTGFDSLPFNNMDDDIPFYPPT